MTGTAAGVVPGVPRWVNLAAHVVPLTTVPWIVLGDPEGNEFCILGSRSA